MSSAIAIPFHSTRSRYASPDSLADDWSVALTDDSSIHSSPLSASPASTPEPEDPSLYPPVCRSPLIIVDDEDEFEEGEKIKIPTLEREFCFNFKCCGKPLNDMYDLLSHIENVHSSADGKLLPASDPQDSSSDLSTPSSAAVTPPPDAPLSDHDEARSPSAFDTNAAKYYAALTADRARLVRNFSIHSQPGSVVGSDYDDDTMMDLDMPTCAYPEPVCLSPTLLSVPREERSQPSEAVGPAPPSQDAPPESIISLEASAQSNPAKPQKKPSAERMSEVGPITWTHSHHSPGRKPKSSSGSGSRRQKAYKAYKCPHEGCIKAYLNPNGLKYHLKKGTCEFNNAMGSSASSEEN